MINDSTITIREAIAGDLPGLVRLERQSASAAHWTDAQYRSLFDPSALERLVLVAQQRDTAIAGFLVAHHIAPDWELENVVVCSEQRRMGVGTRLLNDMLRRAKQASGHSVFLEVRESNSAARAFYEKTGFRPMGRRKSYYADPPEDAILFTLTLR